MPLWIVVTLHVWLYTRIFLINKLAVIKRKSKLFTLQIACSWSKQTQKEQRTEKIFMVYSYSPWIMPLQLFNLYHLFPGLWGCYHQENKSSFGHWYLRRAPDTRPVQHDRREAWWLSHWSGHLACLSVSLWVFFTFVYFYLGFSL